MDSLINLDSPVVRNRLPASYSTRSPLIPCPAIPSLNCSEPQNNPFDAVANAVAWNQQPNDPFDIVLKASINEYNTGPHKVIGNEDFKDDDDDEEIKKENDKPDSELSDETDLIKIKSNVKEFVTERIISCIKKVMSTSSESGSTNLNQSNYRRSFSAGVLRPAGSGFKVEKTNISTYLNTSLPLEGSYYSRDLSRSSSGIFRDGLQSSAKNDCNDFELTKMQLRREAKKMTDLLTQRHNSSSSERDSIDDSSEDLLDSSAYWWHFPDIAEPEEDSIGLPKLITYRHSFSENTNKSILEEKIVHEYLKRRLSNECKHLNQENKEEESSQMIECFIPDKVAASSSIIEDEEIPVSEIKRDTNLKQDKQIDAHFIVDKLSKQPLRPKKTIGHEFLKKGPMKAVVPLQKMTKQISAKLSSPFKNKIQHRSDNAKNEDVETEIKPVAASTPSTQSPVSSATKSRLRGRENNKMSPTGRKASRRSSSIGFVGPGMNRAATPSHTPTKAPVQFKINKAVTSRQRGRSLRPQSAPNDSVSEHQVK